MTTLKTIYTTFVLFLFFCAICQAQHVVNIPNIDLIAHDHESFMLFEKIGEDAFKAIDIEFSSQNHGFSKVHIDRDNYSYTQLQINEEYGTILFVDQLKPNGFDDLRNTEWDIKSEDIEDDEHLILKFSDNNFTAFYDLEAIKRNEYDEQSQWEVVYSSWYQPVIVDFGNNKHIILLNEGSNIDFAIIPVNNRQSPLVLSEDEKIKEIIPIEKNQYFITLQDEFYDFEFSDMYQKVVDEEKFRLFDYYGNDLLGKAFDNIEYNNYFIVVENDGNHFVYDSLLNLFSNFNASQEIYFDTYGLEILIENDAFYFHNARILFRELPTGVSGAVCGNSSFITHEILPSDHKKQPYSLTIITGGFGSGYQTEKTVLLKDIRKKYTISFINDQLKDYAEENDKYSIETIGFPEYLKVKYKNAVGLISYTILEDARNIADTIPHSKFQKRITYKKPFQAKIKTELSVKFDRIEIVKNNHIFFYKDNKVGIFPHHRKVTYELLEKVSTNFYKIIKNGKSGWLDIKTMKEYFF